MAGLQFGNLISGAVLVETVFSWPGLGTLVSTRSSGATIRRCWGC
ncbi:MAG: ABC transporter permease subunit [Burkholderiaceae bacterium]